jgi:Family of unknown function (DUF6526)
MATQSFENHAHQPVLTGIGYLFLVIAIVGFALRWFAIGGRTTMALGLAGLIATNLTLLLISRTYTTKLQDRIIKIEMRMRGAGLLTPEQQRLLMQLGNKQIVALRFASDAELPMLVERAARERLPPVEIKRAVKTWVPDLDRT